MTDRWIIAGTPINRPYPCRCKLDNRDGHCWMLNPGAVDWATRQRALVCRCWGQDPDRAEETCCRTSPDSIALFHRIRPGRDVDKNPDPPAPVVVEPDTGDIYVPPAADPDPAEDVDIDQVTSGLVRDRIAAILATCTCKTPWDNDRSKRHRGYHCPDCHTSWASATLAEMHRRDVFARCREPATIRDVGTGEPLLVATRVAGGLMVWSARTRG